MSTIFKEMYIHDYDDSTFSYEDDFQFEEEEERWKPK